MVMAAGLPHTNLSTQLLGWVTEPLCGDRDLCQSRQPTTVLCNLGIFSSRDASRKEADADHQAVSEVDRAAKVSTASALWLLLCAPVIPIICTYLAPAFWCNDYF